MPWSHCGYIALSLLTGEACLYWVMRGMGMLLITLASPTAREVHFNNSPKACPAISAQMPFSITTFFCVERLLLDVEDPDGCHSCHLSMTVTQRTSRPVTDLPLNCGNALRLKIVFEAGLQLHAEESPAIRTQPTTDSPAGARPALSWTSAFRAALWRSTQILLSFKKKSERNASAAGPK